tara:strand:+ start:621 stop:1328 length:708 start_codon:yes stop_codon:yes gene_type:complete
MKKINTALILCAGLGERLRPLTLNIPKPLLKVKNLTLLENTLNFVNKLKIENVYLNSFYLSETLLKFVSNLDYKNIKIDVINDGKKILNTGGGILNMIKESQSDNFLTLNPDTIWSEKNIEEILNMENFYLKKKVSNILLVTNKKNSFDKDLKGDFTFQDNILYKKSDNQFLYTGCQILNKKIFIEIRDKVFPMSKIWNILLKRRNLYGFESNQIFNHISNLSIYKKFLENDKIF